MHLFAPRDSGRWRAAARCSLLALLVSLPSSQAETTPPSSTGDAEKGSVTVNLYRGAAVPFELTVIATPNNCSGHLTLDLSWNKSSNKVKVHLTGEPGSLEPHPTIERTKDVDFFPNPFFQEPEDYENGRYQLWIISASGPATTFYYDPGTLDLLGSEHDFDAPPPAIPVPFPTLYLFSTPMFQPAADGSVDLDWEFPYDGAIRGDRPEYAHHIVTFPPPNLCGANPNRLDLSTLRPYITEPFDASEARPWTDYLRGGLLFDVTVEPPEYFQEPPRTSLAATYSGGTAVGGGIPDGFTLDIDAAFMGVAPPVRPWKGRDSCSSDFAGVHTQGLNFCPAGDGQ